MHKVKTKKKIAFRCPVCHSPMIRSTKKWRICGGPCGSRWQKINNVKTIFIDDDVVEYLTIDDIEKLKQTYIVVINK